MVLLFGKLLLYFPDCVGPDVVVLLIGDAGQLLLGPAFLHLDGDGPVEVAPVLEDGVLPLQLPDLVQESVPSPGQHEIYIEVDLPSFRAGVLDLGDDLVVGGVGPEVAEGDHDGAVLEVVTAPDVFLGQRHVQLGEDERLDVVDEGLLQLLLGSDQAVQVVVGPGGDDEGPQQRLLLHLVRLVLQGPCPALLVPHLGADVLLLPHELDQLLHGVLQFQHQGC